MKFAPLVRLIKQTPGLKLLAATAVFLIFLEAVSAPILAYIMQNLVDGFLLEGAESYWIMARAALILIAAVAGVAWVRTWVLGGFSERATANLRDRAADRLLHMPVPRLDSIHTGDHLSRLTNDIAVVKNYLYFEMFWLISLPLAAILSLIYLVIISWEMTLATLALIPVFIWINTKVSAPIGKISTQLQQELAAVNSVTQDALGGTEVVKAFNLHGEMERRFEHHLEGTINSGLRLAWQRALLRVASAVAGFLPFLLPLILGGWFAINGRITVGNLLAFVQLLNFVTFPLSRMPVALGEHQKSMAALDRVHQLIDEPMERNDGGDFPNLNGTVLEVKDLIFGYEDETILTELSFSLGKGETVALVGPSGAGKSTVFKVLTGFYPQDSGSVQLFGQPLEDWNLTAARQQMAMVGQDTFLFPGTIAENIALGKPAATREEIIGAATQANAHTFIEEFPDGYDHVLAERGANLSGGQRQRLAIARAILLDASILLLDEATSALDTESERLVQDALDAMASTRTTLVIAHRLSTIRKADRILVMDNGKIVESGSHQDLLDQGGLYRQLYLRQFADATQNGGVAS